MSDFWSLCINNSIAEEWKHETAGTVSRSKPRNFVHLKKIDHCILKSIISVHFWMIPEGQNVKMKTV